ncbi:MAG: methyltransferase domain-containing protein [Frankia sp.]
MNRSVSWVDLRQATIWHGLRQALSEAAPDRQLTVVDAGGGSGGFAVPLAEQGHDVTVVDPSPDALASLARRATERGVGGLVHGRQGDLTNLLDIVPPGAADLVLCHNVMEFVDAPADALVTAVGALRPGGLLSVLAANRAAAVLARAVAGKFTDAAAVLTETSDSAAESDLPRPAGRVGPAVPASPGIPARADGPAGPVGLGVPAGPVGVGPAGPIGPAGLAGAPRPASSGGSSSSGASSPGSATRRFDAAGLTKLVNGAGAQVRFVHGVRVFVDLVPSALAEADQSAAEALLRLELAASTMAPYIDIATQLHVLAVRRPDR